MFYPERKENKATTELVHKMAVEVASCLLTELRDPKKATSDYLSSAEGKFSWGETTDEEHLMCIGKMATNDPAESPFAALTRQMQSFGRVLGIHASAIGHARTNGDFKRNIKDPGAEGLWHRLPTEMRHSLLKFALSVSSEVRKSEREALDRQREAKRLKMELIRKRKLEAVKAEYANALTYIDMFHSPACWKTAADVRREFSKLESESARKEAVKEQIRIRVIGFGWTDVKTAWSKGGVDYSAEHLRDHLLTVVLPYQKNRKIPNKPAVKPPSRGDRQQLGTQSADVVDLDKRYEKEKDEIERDGKELRETLELEGKVDRYEKMQPKKQPAIDENFIGAEIEQLWDFKEPDGTIVNQWCRGEVVAVKKNNKVHVQWDKSCLREGDPEITEETFLKSKWNKHSVRAWRMYLGD